MSTDTPDTQDPAEPVPTTTTGRRFPRWARWVVAGVVALVVIGYGLVLLYAKVLNDSPDELGAGDLAAALAEGDGEPAGNAASGRWVVTDASELGYRVNEVLFGVDTAAVGRTNRIDGSFTIDDTTVTAAEFTVDVASISSDDGRRDRQFRERIMSTDEFPTATFTLTEPIELGVEPADGVSVDVTAVGELTLRGVTNPVTFDLRAQQENGQIGVLGDIPVVFADFAIANPSFGGITTEDHGLLEFVLVLRPA